jgi:hypothetical protein
LANKGVAAIKAASRSFFMVDGLSVNERVNGWIVAANYGDGLIATVRE